MDFIEILKVILLGIVEGITEWLPVSSTGHMLLVNSINGLSLNQTEAFVNLFLIVIQLGAILAVVVMFWKRLFPFHLQKTEETETSEEIKEEGTETKDEETSTDNVAMKTVKTKLVADMGILKLWAKVIVACLPAAVLGLAFDETIENFLSAKIGTLKVSYETLVIALTLIIYGVAFIVIEKRNKNRTLPIQSVHDITYKQALIIGAFQVLSLIPGTSRSGSTIIGALLIGVARPAGAEFTFFLAIPIMFGASAYKLLDFFLENGALTGPEIGYLLIGMAVAFAVSIALIKFLMDFVKKHDFKVFGWYRIALGALVIGALVIPAFF
ncbi:MAG: undecaprenyl-diphosphate phosphatase [Clostridiales bacterium]|nr:undecaprenyl-diphosphate phosphatase [Clostridiales bacterium]